MSPNLYILLRDFDLLLEDPNNNFNKITENQYLEELLKLESNKKIDNYKLNPMKTRICN